MVAPAVHIYMLTEDAGAHTHATWAALLRRMCRLVDSSCDTQPRFFFVEQPEEGARKTMAGNQWRTQTSHRRLVEFWRTVAEQLESSKIVAFHVDADVTWPGDSANVRDVETIARRRLQNVMEDRGRTPEEVASRMAFFVPLHPFREIEAWLFHNVPVLRRICARRSIDLPTCAEAWEAQPALLDAEPRPKATMPFGADHNRDLAEDTFPANRVYALGTSFYHAVEALKKCAPLRSALEQTYSAERWQA